MTVPVYLIISGVTAAVTIICSVMITFQVKKKEFNQKIKADISVQQMRILEDKIKTFLTEHNIKENQSIEEIAKVLNVEQGNTESNLKSQAYLKEIDKTEKKVVIFKSGLSEEERRFAFSHELAHLVNGDSIPATRPNGRNKAYLEQLADYTAAALLMPSDEVYRYLEKQNYRNLSTRQQFNIVKKLCKKYNVSEIIVLRRIKEIQMLNQQSME